MANTGVKGRVTDEQGSGIGGLNVVAHYVDILNIEELLGSAKT
jgi:hypothetical protein